MVSTSRPGPGGGCGHCWTESTVPVRPSGRPVSASSKAQGRTVGQAKRRPTMSTASAPPRSQTASHYAFSRNVRTQYNAIGPLHGIGGLQKTSRRSFGQPSAGRQPTYAYNRPGVGDCRTTNAIASNISLHETSVLNICSTRLMSRSRGHFSYSMTGSPRRFKNLTK